MSYSLAFWHSVSVATLIAIKMEHDKCEYLTTKHISEVLDIPHSTVRKILKQLTLERLIITREGAKGGVILTKEPKEITLLNIFNALEQKRPMFKTGSIMKDNDRAERIGKRAKQILQSSENSLKEQLEDVTLQDLLDE